MRGLRMLVAIVIITALSVVATADAQPLGTYRWQQLPYCNVITLNVVQSGSIYQLDGFDDQCGGATPRASVVGTAFLNPDGTVGMGLAIVTAPSGTPLQVSASLNPISITGGWKDTNGNTGAFIFTPGAPLPGGPRPAPRAVFPMGLSAAGTTIGDVASPVAATDAANRNYVDAVAATKAGAADVSLVVPVANSGVDGAFVFPAPVLTLGNTTFTTPRAGHVLVDLNVAGSVTCATSSSTVWWIEVDGVAVRSSARSFAEGTTDFTFTGIPPFSISGVTAAAVSAGPHTAAVRGACASGAYSGTASNSRFTGRVTVLDAGYGSRAAAVAELAPASAAAPCAVARGADGVERRECQ